MALRRAANGRFSSPVGGAFLVMRRERILVTEWKALIEKRGETIASCAVVFWGEQTQARASVPGGGTEAVWSGVVGLGADHSSS